jgi:hypothetical protein
MPEDNKGEPSSPFSNEPYKGKKASEARLATEPVNRWATVSGLVPGVILVILAVLFLLSNYGILKGEWWQYFLALLLMVFLIEYWVVYISPVRGRSRLKMGLVGLLLIGSGILFLFNVSVWWPLILLAAGIILIFMFLVKKRRTHKLDESAMNNTLTLL